MNSSGHMIGLASLSSLIGRSNGSLASFVSATSVNTARPMCVGVVRNECRGTVGLMTKCLTHVMTVTVQRMKKGDMTEP